MESPYKQILFERVNEWQSLPRSGLGDKFVAFADELELDQTKFISCLQSETVAEEVQSDLLDGGRYGVTGTPGFFIGNEESGFIKVSGAQPYANFQRVLDQILEG